MIPSTHTKISTQTGLPACSIRCDTFLRSGHRSLSHINVVNPLADLTKFRLVTASWKTELSSQACSDNSPHGSLRPPFELGSNSSVWHRVTAFKNPLKTHLNSLITPASVLINTYTKWSLRGILARRTQLHHPAYRSSVSDAYAHNAAESHQYHGNSDSPSGCALSIMDRLI